MSANANAKPTRLKLRKVGGVLDDMSQEDHLELLGFLLERLKGGNINRSSRLMRYARIDKTISTWQMLSAKDSENEAKQDNTGRAMAQPMNLPILASHLEDSVAFFAEVFSPQGHDFYSVPANNELEAAVALTKKMNRDTRARKYYKELCMGLRSLLKYNLGGFAVRWEAGGGVTELAEPGNRIEAIDLYNYLWDQSITDVSKIPTEAEWAARATHKNRMWLQRRALKGALQRVDILLEDDARKLAESNSGTKGASFYRIPPTHAGLATDGKDQRTSATKGVDWASYGATLEGDTTPDIEGYEVVEMYCWVNPTQLKLLVSKNDVGGEEGLDENGESLALWKFTIVDGCQVCSADVVESNGETGAEIPHYLGHMTQDDMKEAQRSVMELLKPFQGFASFLMNIYVAGARKNIWGLKGIDPSMFDSSTIEAGDVAGVLNSKVPGRDVRTGLMTLDSSSGVDGAFDMMDKVLGVMRALFPSQALPSQIAQIDRAVKNQVSAVLHGVHRRLHMSAKLIDADLMSPMRVQCYRNLAKGDSDGLTGLTEEAVAKVLGSGLQQLNREAVAAEMKELIFTLMQNPESASNFDLIRLFTLWSQLMDSPTNLGDLMRQPPPPTVQPGTPGAPGAEAGIPAMGGAAL